jgi:5-methylcytosine-specific restriction endonuclease McrA
MILLARNHGTTRTGSSFSDQTINAVWNKGQIVAGYDANIYRKDVYGLWMKKQDHGNTLSDYGWEIDHIIPVAKGGSDDLNNLQPLYWKNNRTKSDN